MRQSKFVILERGRLILIESHQKARGQRQIKRKGGEEGGEVDSGNNIHLDLE